MATMNLRLELAQAAAFCSATNRGSNDNNITTTLPPPSPAAMSSGGSPVEYKAIEFRSDDDSWYDVRLELRGENLIVRYCDFPHEQEVFKATAYGRPEKIEQLQKRFRPLSLQIQDRECSKVVHGMTVCASHAFGQNEVHFYDAVVEEAFYKEHSFANGEEECLCTFVLFWQHGPNAGNLTAANVANICLIQQSAHTHPLLTSFLKMARRKFEIGSHNSRSDSEGYNNTCSTGSCHGEVQSLGIRQKSSFSQLAIQELPGAVQPMDSKGMVVNFCERIETDTDMGGETRHHIVLVDNLEIELAASTIVDFINEQTSITPQVYVFPNISLDPYTQGIIVLNCKKKFEKICDFLDNPNHIIVSSRGRPWMTREKIARSDPFRTALVTLLLTSENQFRYGSFGIRSQLKLVLFGTQEFDIAKQRRDAYADFFDHLRRLHKRLVFEDNEILKQSRQV